MKTPGLRDVPYKTGYDTVDEALHEFYIPVLSRSISYARSVGYFRASSLRVAARGLSHFIRGGGTVRLLIGAEVTRGDLAALQGATEVPDDLALRLRAELVPPDEIARERFAVLAWLAKEKRLHVRIAIAVDESGKPIAAEDLDGPLPYFHEKIGVLRDASGDGVAFQGSVNESAQAWTRNFDSFSVYCSWNEGAPWFDHWANKFEERWAGKAPGFKIFELPDAVAQKLYELAPSEPPPIRDPEEVVEAAGAFTAARFIAVAPNLIGAESVAEATIGVQLFPHQRQVLERLAGEYPRSWLVADEVGLGKTVSAGLALRRLLISGQVTRALILAPANVCNQWQDELFEKFGLWVPRLDGNRFIGPHPDDVELIPDGANPYALKPVLIASSHLARRASHRRRLASAGSLDLLIVDEAHHARRRRFDDPSRYEPNTLLQLLDDLVAGERLSAVWLLTATPMQIDPIELRDLLRYVGLTGRLENHKNFLRYFAEVGTNNERPRAWGWLADAVRSLSLSPPGAAEQALLTSIEAAVGPVQRDRIERFATGKDDPAALVEELGPYGRDQLLRWLRHLSPVGQLVTRHTRATLKKYRDAGILKEPVADREVKAVPIPFETSFESDIYDDLDDLIDRLLTAHGTRKGAGFVLTVYRRRLTSSWEAIRRTLRRRLAQETLVIEMDLLDEADDEELDTGDGRTIEDSRAVPLSDEDIEAIENYLERLDRVEDSKFNRLQMDLNEARSTGQAAIVFTQFTDTLDYLRDRLTGAFRSQLATFTGNGGRHYRDDLGWADISKKELVEAIQSGRITVVLATDAASEGLNLQACSYLINFDLPWNPMRVEQRIGRVDRIGQRRKVVSVRNYVIPGTVEESVYNALSNRIDDFSDLLGSLQPILGATEQAFRRIFQAPRSERIKTETAVIGELMQRIDELADSGIELGSDDPMPITEPAPSPISLAQLKEWLTGPLNISLDEPNRPASFDPDRASRDIENWCSLATYGHPRLLPSLRAVGEEASESALVIRRGEMGRAVAVRADRTPPELVRNLDDLHDLGPAVSMGEAESLARNVLASEEAEYLRKIQQVLFARTTKWRDEIIRRFKKLVAETVGAECAAERIYGDGAIDPVLIWHNLTGDSTSGWAYAETFQQLLGVELRELVPSSLAQADVQGSLYELKGRRRRTGSDLIALMQEWKEKTSLKSGV